MAVSWEEMTGAAQPQPKKAELPAGAVTAEEMFGGAASAPVVTSQQSASSFLQSAGVKQYWDDYVRLSNEYAASLKADSKANPQTLAGQVAQSGKTLLHAIGAAFSPLESVARTGIIQPVEAAINKMSELAQQHLAAPDVYDAQKRRENWLMGAPVVQQYPGGVDWQIHRSDVARTAAGINRFTEIGVLTGVGFVGGKRPVEMAAEPSSLRSMVRMEASAAANVLQGLKEASSGALREFPGLKNSVERLTDDIRQLAIRDPEAADALASHVGTADPVLGAKVQEIATEAKLMKPQQQEALGEQLAKPRARQVGVTPQGKPILRLVQPEEGLSSAVAEGYQALRTPSTTSPEVVAAANKAYTAQLLREAGETPASIEVSPMVKTGPDASAEVQQFAKDWNDLHTEMMPRYEAAVESGRPLRAHLVLDTMLAHARGDYQRSFIAKLRSHVDNVPIGFHETLINARTPKTMGLYDPAWHTVNIKVIPGSGATTHALLHELTHAATLNWMRANPAHYLMNEIEELWHEAKLALGEGSHYGLKNAEEFVAEAMTNARFQKALLGVKAKSGVQNLFSRLADIIRKVFGMSPGEGVFLHRVLQTSESIMAEQRAAGRLKSTGQAAAVEIPPRVRAEAEAQTAFRAGVSLSDIPGMPLVLGKLRGYYEQIIQTVNPEAFGAEAKAAAAVLAKRIAQSMQRDSLFVHRAAERKAFWNRLGPREQMDFIRKFEKGQAFATPELERVALFYKVWNERIYNQDLRNGLQYDPVDNYLYHAFEDSQGVSAFLSRKYGVKWGDPAFMKGRGMEAYEQAVAAGFKPRFTNPEDIMLARQHASDVAQMRIDVLNDLERFGLAQEAVGSAPPAAFSSTKWRSPTGKTYWVHGNAERVMQNAFNTKSLWNEQGLVGDAFRSAMWLKNTIVPIKLALSLFHPLHVATIDNATGMVRASKELLSGTIGPAKFLKEMAKSTLYLESISAARSGNRLLRAYQGKVPDAQITASEVESLRLMAEGGFIPEMASQYRTGAMGKFQSAVQRRSAAAAWHLPFAVIEAMQYPMFQVWIPSLKIASYLKDVRTALATDPTLLNEPLKRQMAFRRIAKSVDNRYGEMAYNTLFWNRWVKDLAVANTLSLGWQLGFIREYGGGALDLGQFLKPGSPVQKIREGQLDRALFVTYYTTQALAYGGLMTWALSGNAPETLMDYIYPKNGEQNPDGSEQRVTTMFYPREFAAIYKHVENEGLVSGLGHLAANKASGVVGLTSEWATGVNSFGQEIRDPNADAFKKLQQTLAYTLTDLEPISIGSIREQATESPVKTTLMNVAGFSPAPKYVTETKIEGEIKLLYQKYLAPKQTSFDRAQYSDDARMLRRHWDAGDTDKFSDLLEQMQEKYELTGQEIRRLQVRIQRGSNPMLSMFSRLTWQQQKRLLDQMTDDEREVYLPKSNKQHLRYSYEPPEK